MIVGGCQFQQLRKQIGNSFNKFKLLCLFLNSPSPRRGQGEGLVLINNKISSHTRDLLGYLAV